MTEHSDTPHGVGGPFKVSDDHYHAYGLVTDAIHRADGSEMERAYLMHLWELGRKHAQRYHRERGLIP